MTEEDFRVKVCLRHLKVQRTDGEEEDDFKTWAETSILRHNGEPWSSLWYSATTDDEETARLRLTSVTNGVDAALNFTRNSKHCPCSEGIVAFHEGAALKVRVFKGGSRDPDKDELIGETTVPLGKLLDGDTVDESVTLSSETQPAQDDGGEPMEPKYRSVLQLSVSADRALVESRRGGRFLTLGGGQLSPIPPAFWLPYSPDRNPRIESATEASLSEEDHEERRKLCDDPEANTHRYVLLTNLQRWERDVDATGVAPTEWDTRLGHGTLCYEHVSPPESAPAEEGDQSEAGAGTSSAGEWRWAIRWTPTTIFLSNAEVEEWKRRLGSGNRLRVQVRRVETAPVEADDPTDHSFGLAPGRRALAEDPWGRGEVWLALDGLLEEGSTETDAKGTVDPVTLDETARKQLEEDAEAREASWEEHMRGKGGAAAAGKGKDKKGDKKGDKKAAAPAKGKKGKKDEPEPAEAAEPPPHPFEAVPSELSLTVAVDTPLVLPRPPSPPPRLQVSDLVSPRPRIARRGAGVDATTAFQREVIVAAHAIAEQYIAVVQELEGNEDASAEFRRRAVLQALNTSGVYHSLKERMKRAAIRIVRERFPRSATETTEDDSIPKDVAESRFLADLYAVLMQDVHRALHSAFADAEQRLAGVEPEDVDPMRRQGPARSLGDHPGGIAQLLRQPAAAAGTTEDPLLESRESATPSQSRASGRREADDARHARLALEAEVQGFADVAARWLHTRITRCERMFAGVDGDQAADPMVWFSYAEFLLRQREPTRAAECLREALAIDDAFAPALLALSALELHRGALPQARVLGEAAAKHWSAMDADSLTGTGIEFALDPIDRKTALPERNGAAAAVAHAQLSWTLEQMADAEVTIHDDVSTLRQLCKEHLQSASDAFGGEPAGAGLAYLRLGLLWARWGLQPMAAESVARADTTLAELETMTPEIERALALSKAWLYWERDEDGDAALASGQMLQLTGWALKGLVEFRERAWRSARASFELAVGEWENAPPPPLLVLLRLGELYLRAAQTKEDNAASRNAEQVFLLAAERSGWAFAWTGVGRACLLRRDADAAESAFCEANVRDPEHPGIWIWLAVAALSAKPPRTEESTRAVREGLRRGARGDRHGEPLHAVGTRLEGLGEWAAAETVWRAALIGQDMVAAPRIRLGNVLLEQGSWEQAENAFHRAAAITRDRRERGEAVAGWITALRSQGKNQDAEDIELQYGADLAAVQSR